MVIELYLTRVKHPRAEPNLKQKLFALRLNRIREVYQN